MIAHLQGWLLVRFVTDNGQVAYMQPIGTGDIRVAVEALAADAASLGVPLRLYGLCEHGCSQLESLYPGRVATYASPANFDYIYLAEDLATLAGRKYQPKRNHINRFLSRYSYRFEPLSASNIEDCIYLNSVWCSQKGTDSSAAEQRALQRAFDNFGVIPFKGWILYANGNPCAFAIGSQINHDTFCIHIEKADVTYEGAGAMINNLVAIELSYQYKYINREDDLGIEGLRRAKQSYYPVELLAKHSALLLDEHLTQLRELWIDCFGDSLQIIDHFMVSHYDPALCYTHIEAGRVVGMLHIVPMVISERRCAYIYAVATDSRFRGRGIATELMTAALRDIDRGEYDYAALIPADSHTAKFYERFGFESTGELFDFSDFDPEYDFGTGDSSLNFAMIRKKC